MVELDTPDWMRLSRTGQTLEEVLEIILQFVNVILTLIVELRERLTVYLCLFMEFVIKELQLQYDVAFV